MELFDQSFWSKCSIGNVSSLLPYVQKEIDSFLLKKKIIQKLFKSDSYLCNNITRVTGQSSKETSITIHNNESEAVIVGE